MQSSATNTGTSTPLGGAMSTSPDATSVAPTHPPKNIGTSSTNTRGAAAPSPYSLAASRYSLLSLAPLAGYTNLPTRLSLRSLGGLDITTTDLINARSLINRNPVALKLAATHPDDSPLAIQLFGTDPLEMRDAAQVAQSLGASSIDINMGCPAPKVTRLGAGSALMAQHSLAVTLARTLVDALKIPVTVKMRLGIDSQNITAPDLAPLLEDAGISSITVHGRTRAQGFSGAVNLPAIAATVRSLKKIPLIANGDITTPQVAKRVLNETNAAGLAIGRGALHNPWLFQQIRSYLNNGTLPPDPSTDERLDYLRRHLHAYIQFYGPSDGPRRFRKIAPWHLRLLGPCKPLRQQLATLSSPDHLEELITQYKQWRHPFCTPTGTLLPRYLPPPLHSSLDNNSNNSAASSLNIPLPKGPVSHW